MGPLGRFLALGNPGAKSGSHLHAYRLVHLDALTGGVSVQSPLRCSDRFQALAQLRHRWMAWKNEFSADITTALRNTK
jgi:hypothetical protein